MTLYDESPFVGNSSFAHKGGMHIDAVTKCSKSYEHIDPKLVGNKRRFLVSEVSGKSMILQEIKKIFPNVSKDDVAVQKITDRLKELVDFVVFPREDNFKPESLERFRNAGYNFICVDMPFINLSSTVLRSRIKHGKPIGNLVPQKVQEYIKKKTLF